MIVVASPTPPRLLTEARQVSGNQGGLTVQLEDPDVPEGEATTVDLPSLLTGDPELGPDLRHPRWRELRLRPPPMDVSGPPDSAP